MTLGGYRRILACLCIAAAVGAQSPSRGYLDDFEFIRKAVKSRSAALARHKVDWKTICKQERPAFAKCKDDATHVKNVMRLLAHLRDSHTDVWRHSIKGNQLPSKWDGLFGGGLWFGWDQGHFVLRRLMKNHALGTSLPAGSILRSIDGKPAWLTMAIERRRVTTHHGSSSEHSLFTSMSNRMLPFGDQQTLEAEFLKPDGEVKKVQIRRWGPGGKAFYPFKVQFPDGLDWKKGAVATMLKLPWSRKVGWLRITGGMDQQTAKAFHEKLDGLRDMEALILDCRSMGGGGDDSAWEMAGRFFKKAVPNGPRRQITPTGSWQFAGPVVMLQNESEISSAETFTWAMSETKRVVSVGRPTGGWGIIPTILKCPSGILDIRLGVNDRPTPISGVRTEGIGWPPDVLIPYGPRFCERPDPAGEVGREILQLLHGGIARKDVVAAFKALFDGDSTGFKKRSAPFARRVKKWNPTRLARLARDDLKATLEMEIELLKVREGVPPDATTPARRLDGLLARARKARFTKQASALKKAMKKIKAESAAQAALLTLVAADSLADPKQRTAWLRKHKKTRTASWVKAEL